MSRGIRSSNERLLLPLLLLLCARPALRQRASLLLLLSSVLDAFTTLLLKLLKKASFCPALPPGRSFCPRRPAAHPRQRAGAASPPFSARRQGRCRQAAPARCGACSPRVQVRLFCLFPPIFPSAQPVFPAAPTSFSPCLLPLIRRVLVFAKSADKQQQSTLIAAPTELLLPSHSCC